GAENIFGFTEKDMLGESFLKIIPQSDRPAIAETFSQIIRTSGTSLSGRVHEIKGLKKSGTEVPVEIALSVRKIDENFIITAIIRDITERKRAEEIIKSAAREWRTTFDSINEMIAVVDKNFRIVRVNMSFARAFKKRPEELLGSNCHQMFHKTEQPPPHCPLLQAINNRQSHTIEYFESNLGIYIEETVSPVLDEQGQVAYCVHVCRDITERKKAEENLRKIDRMKTEFLSNVSHELRTPLQSISGFIKLILEGKVPDAATQHEFLQIVDREAWHLGNLINSLLDMSRLESGRFKINRKPTPVKDTIIDTLKIFKTLAREKNIEFKEDIDSDLPIMEVDGERLRQVVINLLSNAIKFSDPGSAITVRVKKMEKEILLQVADQGIGMSPADMEHLFERFYRAEDRLSRGGTGLGLYITKQIVEAHGGRIWVESKLHEGSTFSVTLPFN
ncbi:MAG: ATP-binding protein, partial [candidate division WOR-3 bacterium]